MSEPNHAPEFISSPDLSAYVGSEYTYNIQVNDVDENDVLTVTVKNKPTWLDFSGTLGNYKLSGEPAVEHIADHMVELIVNDGTVDVSQSFTISVINNNQPRITSSPKESVNNDQEYRYEITFEDDDLADQLTLSSKTELPSWLKLEAIDNGTAILSGTPTNEQVGSYPIDLILTDGKVEVTHDFVITVVENICPVLQSDIDALREFYQSTGGKNWFSETPGHAKYDPNKTWSDENPVCNWYGIQVDENTQRVKYLYLSKNNLIGQLPNSIKQLDALVSIDLKSNDLSEEIPNTIGELYNLEYLMLGMNNLSGPIPTSLGNLSNLKWLSLRSNELHGGIPEQLKNLSELQILWLNFNNLSEEIPLWIGDLSKLEYLWLNYNNLTGPIPLGLNKLIKLKELYLSDNLLTHSIQEDLGSLPEISILELGDNFFEGIIPFQNWPDRTSISTNKYTFEDLIPHRQQLVVQDGKVLIYNSQRTFGQAKTVEAIAGKPFVYDIDIDETIDGSTYSWYKQNGTGGKGTLAFEYTTDGTKNNDLEVTLTEDQAGTYVVYVTNNQFKDADGNALLTLQSEPITINVTQPVDCVPQSEREALMALYNSTGGPNWKNNTNWGSKEPVSEWFGVTVDKDLCRVTKLQLNGNNLRGSIPSEIKNLPYLRYLNFNLNALTGNIPPEITTIESLEILYLNSNMFTGSLPSNIGFLNQLKEIDLLENNVDGKIPESICQLINLEYLNLSWNQFSGDLPQSLGNLKKLRFIDLSVNNLSGVLPSSFEDMSLLEDLILAYNSFSGTIPTGLGKLSNLKTLDLRSNEFTGQLPGDIGSLSGLKYLYVSNNYLEGEIPGGAIVEYSLLNHNKYTFEDFVPHQIALNNPSGKTLRYSPQRKFGQSTTDEAISGEPFTYSIAIDENVIGSTYSWYKQDIENGTESLAFEYTTNGTKNNDLEVTLTEDQAGTYVVYVTNDQFKDADGNALLTLQSEPITINVVNPADCVPQSERDALMALYNATDGPNWKNNTNWGTDTPVSEWYGVTVEENIADGSCSVTKLSLVRNELNGSIPAGLSQLSNLNFLRFAFNDDLIGHIPPELGKLTKLEYLSLAFNSLTGPIPGELGGLSKLEKLYLFDNYLTDAIPPELGLLSSLQYLDFSNNSISGPIPASIGSLTKLEDLNLSFNDITEFIPDEISLLVNLRSLKLSNNLLRGPIPGTLSKLINGSIFHFSFNNLNGIIPPELSETGAVLYVSNNNFTFSEIIDARDAYKMVGVGMYYPPQKKFGKEESVNAISGESFVFNITIDEEMVGSTYSWYREGTTPDSGSPVFEYTTDGTKNNDLEVTLTEDQAGTYVVYVTNDQFKDADGNALLTLQSEPITINVSHCDVPAEERQALIDLYNSTGGDNWKNNTNWLSELPVRFWYGVTVDETCGSVSQILLKSNNLSGHINESIGDLKGLKRLGLHHNYIGGPLPVRIGELTELTELWLWNNKFTGSIPPEYGKLSKVERFYLCMNELTGPLPAELEGLSSVQYFDVSRCQLNGEIPPIWGKLSNLITLALWDNDFHGTIPESIGELSNLQDLFICLLPDVSGTIPPSLSGLKSIRHFYIYDTQVEGEVPDIFDGMSSLTHVRLKNNRLTGDLPKSLSSNANLTQMQVEGNFLTGGINADYRSLTKINMLKSYDNQMTFEDLISYYTDKEGDNFMYAPQKPFGEVESVVAIAGQPFVYNIQIDENIIGSTYSWYKQDIENGTESLAFEYTTDGTKNNDLEVTLSEDQAGTYVVYVTNNQFKDADGNALLTLQSEPVTISINHTPSFCSEPQMSLAAPNVSYNYTVCVTDKDLDDELTVRLVTPEESWLSLSKTGDNTYLLTGTPSKEHKGLDFDVNIEVVDNHNAKANQQFIIQVTDRNNCVPDTEVQILKRFFTDTNGPGWKSENVGSKKFNDKKTWSDDNPVGDWYGVTVEDCHVTELRLSGNDLEGELPEYLQDLKFLRVLRLSGNNFSGIIPEVMCEFTSLEELNLGDNELKGEIPRFSEFGELEHLRILKLHNNELTGQLPEELHILEKLEVIDFSGNSLESEIPVGYENFEKLTMVDFSDNNFEGAIPASIINCPSVNIKGNKYTFEDFKPHAEAINNRTDDGFIYSPQQTFGKETDYEVHPNDHFVHEVLIDESVVGSTYEWYKNNKKPGKGDPSFTFTTTLDKPDNDFITQFLEGEGGKFTAYVTNPVFPDLVLKSNPVTVTINSECSIEDEVLILERLFEDLEGATWKSEDDKWNKYDESKTWNRDNPVNNWYGVTIENCHVTKLSLSGVDVKGELPVYISELSHLKVINLSNNKLGGSIPESLADLVYLTELYLANNDIDGTIPASLGTNNLLERVDLSKNNLHGNIPVAIIECSSSKLNGNKYTFEDLENHESTINGRTDGGLIYAPQQRFGDDVSYDVHPDEDFVHEVSIDESVAGSTYEWYRRGKKPGVDDPSFTYTTTNEALDNDFKAQFLEGEGSRFTAYVTNPMFPELTLMSKTVTVTVNNNCIEDSELEALKTLFTLTNGEGWKSEDVNRDKHKPHETWKDENDITDWKGVDIENCHVVGLNLASNNLTGTLPDIWAQLPYLRYLYLNSNQLEGQVYESIVELEHLEKLRLFKNGLKGDIPFGFGDKEGFKELNLGDNQFTGSIPLDLEDSRSITHIYLQNNAFEVQSIPEGLARIPTLQVLDLGSLKLIGEIPVGFGELENFTELRLDDNDLEGNIPEDLSESNSLKKLYLQKNYLDGEIPGALGDVTTLTHIDLSVNDFTGQLPAELGRLSSLISLNVKGNILKGDIPSYMGETMSSIQTLNLQSNEFTGGVPASFSTLSTLKYLYVQDNFLTEKIDPELGNLPMLSRFYARLNDMDASIPLNILSNVDRTNIRDNKFTFEDLLPHADYLNSLDTKYPIYSPQQRFGKAERKYVNVGEEFTYEIKIDEAEEGNVYEWYSGRNRPGRGAPDFSYTYADNNTNDFSTTFTETGQKKYTIYVSNPELPGFVLLSEPITVIVQNTCVIPQEQINSLIAFYNAAGGPSWNSEKDGDESNDWDIENNPDVRNWYGVEVDESCNIVGLNLCDNNLKGVISDEICGLRYIKWLRLCNNSLQGSVPECTSDLEGLRELDLSDNDLDGDIPDGLCELRRLRKVNLGGNRFSFMDIIKVMLQCDNIDINWEPQRLPDSSDCGELNATENVDFTIRLDDTEQHPSNVYTWYHNDLVIDIDDDKYVVTNGNLTISRVSEEDTGLYYCKVSNSSVADIVIRSCDFNLSISEPCEVPDEQLMALLSVYDALGGENWKSENDNDLTNDWDISRNPDVSRWYGVQLDDNCNVIGLDLSDNDLSGDLPDDICTLNKLRFLNLFKNFITGSLPDCLTDLKELEEVDLGDNDISGDIPDGLCDLPAIKRFKFGGNRFSFWKIFNFISICNDDRFEFDDQRLDGGYTCGKHQVIQGEDYAVNLIVDDPHPDNIYTWYKVKGIVFDKVISDGINYQVDGGDLLIKNVDKTKDGSYFCVITNPEIPGVTFTMCRMQIESYTSCEALELNANNRLINLTAPFELETTIPASGVFSWTYNDALPELQEGLTDYKVYLRVAPSMESEMGFQVPDWAAGQRIEIATVNVTAGGAGSYNMQDVLGSGQVKEYWHWQTGLVYELDEYGDEIIDWSGTGHFYTEPAGVKMTAFDHLQSNAHTNNINWVYSETYLDDGITSQGIVYMDGLGRTRQVQGLNNTEGKILTAEMVYSEEGGGTVQTLPAPKLEKQFGYAVNFFEVEEGNTLYDFSTEHFDREVVQNQATGLTALLDAPKVNESEGTVGHYYSNNSVEDFVDNANGYPYVYNVAYKSPINRTYLSTNGAGEVFRMNGGKENKHFYGKPTKEELIHAFGKNYVDAIDLASISKTMTYDADGVGYITYKDNEGKVIATAMTDAYLDGLQQLDEPGMEAYTIHVNPLEAGMFDGNALGETAVSRFDIPYGEVKVKLHYTLELSSFMNSETGDLCQECKYNVLVKITNNATGVVEYEYANELIPSQSVCGGNNEEVEVFNEELILNGPAGFTVERTITPLKDAESGVDILQEASDNIELMLRANSADVKEQFRGEYFKHEAYYLLRDNYTEEHMQDWVPDIDCYEAFSLYGDGGGCYSSGMMDDASFFMPMGVAIDKYGKQYIADAGNHVIRIVEGLGEVGLFAGEPAVAGTNNSPVTQFNHPSDIVYSNAPAYGARGMLFVADKGRNRVVRLSLDGEVTEVLNRTMVSNFAAPTGLCTDMEGNIYVASENNGLYRITSQNKLEVIDVAALPLTSITDVAVDKHGTLFIADMQGNTIYRKYQDGTWDSLAGSSEGINKPVSIGVDGFNHVFVSNSGDHNIISIDYSQTPVSAGVICGSASGASGDVDDTEDNLGIARFNNPAGILVRNDGDIMLADAGNHKIKNLITTVCSGQVDPREAGNNGKIVKYADEVRLEERDHTLYMTDLDGYFKYGRQIMREEYPLMDVIEGNLLSTSSDLYKAFIAAYDRNYMVQLKEENIEIYSYTVQAVEGADLTSSSMPLLRDNEPIDRLQTSGYQLIKVVINGDCMMNCEIDEDDFTVDCKEMCEKHHHEIKQQMLEVKEEIKNSGYTFNVGKLFKFPFYRLVDHFYPLNEDLYNYLSDDRAVLLYEEYATLKERYAHFDYDMCMRGCTDPDNAKSTPCESCNSVFMDNANEVADSLLNGVEYLLNKWEASIEAGKGFPYTADELCELDEAGKRTYDKNDKVVYNQELLDTLSYHLVDFLFTKLDVTSPVMNMEDWQPQGDPDNACTNCSPLSEECMVKMTYDVSQFPTIIISQFKKALVDAQEAYNR